MTVRLLLTVWRFSTNQAFGKPGAVQRASPPRSTLATYLGLSTSAPDSSGISEIGSLGRAIATLAATPDVRVPPGARRLARVQGRLVTLLAYIERKEGLALFDGERRTASEERWVGPAGHDSR